MEGMLCYTVSMKTSTARKAGIPAGQWVRWAQAEAAGRAAFEAGVAFEANPYPVHDTMAYKSEWAFWRTGWRRAEGAPYRAALRATVGRGW
jgi:hypothetical protein